MYVAHIAPTHALRADCFYKAPYKMCIASQALIDKVYASFFRNAQGFVILDVPTFEEQSTEPFPLDKHLKAIELVCPDEIILPDIWGASVEENIGIAEDAADVLPRVTDKGPVRFMAVPHAKSLSEYLDATERMLNISNVDTIGVAERVEIEFNTPRLTVTEALVEEFPGIQLHFLGCLKHMEDIYSIRVRANVRSMDTVKFVRWGMIHQHPIYGNIPAYPGRGEGYFEKQISDLQLAYISYNMSYWDKFCNKESI